MIQISILNLRYFTVTEQVEHAITTHLQVSETARHSEVLICKKSQKHKLDEVWQKQGRQLVCNLLYNAQETPNGSNVTAGRCCQHWSQMSLKQERLVDYSIVKRRCCNSKSANCMENDNDKEIVRVCFIPDIVYERRNKTQYISVQTADLRAEVQTRHLTNTKERVHVDVPVKKEKSKTCLMKKLWGGRGINVQCTCSLAYSARGSGGDNARILQWRRGVARYEENVHRPDKGESTSRVRNDIEIVMEPRRTLA